jgi:hypothetical protein
MRPAPRQGLPEGVPSDLSVDEVADAVLPLGNRFLPLASEFGLDRYAAASRGTRGGVLFEYLPPGSDLDTWERIGSLFLYRAAPSADEARAILPRYAARMHDTVPIVHHSEVLEGDRGQIFFLHYSAVQGPRREEGLSAIWMPLPGSIANFQLINRGVPFDQGEIAHFREIATGLGALDAR